MVGPIVDTGIERISSTFKVLRDRSLFMAQIGAERK